jgi:hypothetical protein
VITKDSRLGDFVYASWASYDFTHGLHWQEKVFRWSMMAFMVSAIPHSLAAALFTVMVHDMIPSRYFQ